MKTSYIIILALIFIVIVQHVRITHANSELIKASNTIHLADSALRECDEESQKWFDSYHEAARDYMRVDLENAKLKKQQR